MNSDQSIPDRFLPPEASSGGGAKLMRWAVTLIALVVLIVVAYQGYYWLMGNITRRNALMADRESGHIAVPPPVEVKDLEQSANIPAAVTSDPGSISDPDQRRSMCGYLAAELERLNHDFKQPLPPPIVDRIATEIEPLRAQLNHYGCVPSGAQNDSSGAPEHRRAKQSAG
jgi:hypothetical protein